MFYFFGIKKQKLSSLFSFVSTNIPFSVCCIFILGFLLRLYHLPQQSIWFDEWLSYSSLTPLGWKHFLATFRIAIPEHAAAPSYYIFFYFWAQLVGTAPVLLRLFPVVTGSFAIILLYHLTLRFYSHRAGTVSALLLALSPSQIWFSQELRPYGWMFFLALASILSLETALSSPKRPSLRWLLYYLITTLFVFSHLFALLALVPQGIYVLFRRGIRACILWAIPCLILVALLSFSVLYASHVSIESRVTAPDRDAVRYLIYPISKDIVTLHRDLSPPWLYSPPEEISGSLKALLKFRPVFDTTTVLLLLSLLALFIFKHLRRCIKEAAEPLSETGSYSNTKSTKKTDTDNSLSSQFLYSRFLFILCLIISGPMMLALLEVITKQIVMGSSYTAYNMIGLYLAAGFVISQFRHRWLYTVSLLLIIFFYGYQCLIFLPHRTHPEWRGAVDYIADHCKPHDLVIDECVGYPMSRTILFGNTAPVQTAQASSYGDTCTQAVHYFKSTQKEALSDASVWILTEPVFSMHKADPDHAPLQVFKAALEEHGLHVTIKYFPGSIPLSLLKVNSAPDTTPSLPEPFSQALDVLDFELFLSDLTIIPQTRSEEDQLKGAFQRSVGRWPSIFLNYNPQLGFSFLRNKEYRLAAAFGSYLLSRYPYYNMSYYFMGTLLAVAGERERAATYFQHAFSLNPHMAFYAAAYSEALCNSGGEQPSPALSEKLLSFPLTFFVDLDRFLQENTIADPEQEDNTRKILPQEIRDELRAHLPDGAALSETVFAAQNSPADLNSWLPITKRMPALLCELRRIFTGKDESAAAWYRKHIEKYPFEKILYERFDAYLKKSALPDDYKRQWLELVEKNPDLAFYASQRLAERGDSYWSAGKLKKAQGLYEAALSLNPHRIDTAAKLAARYITLERFEDALPLLSEVLQQDLYFPDALAQANETLQVLDNPERDIAFWQGVHAARSGDWNVIFSLGTALEKANRFLEGADIFLSLDSADANICHARLAAVRCLRLAKEYSKAQTLLDTLSPDHCDPPRLISYEYVETGQVFFAEGDFDASAACFNRALDTGGFDSLANFGLYEISLVLDDRRAALDYLQKSVDADTDNLWHRQMLAQEQLKEGLWDRALDNIEVLLKAKPQDPGLHHQLLSLLDQDMDSVVTERLHSLLKSFSEP